MKLPFSPPQPVERPLARKGAKVHAARGLPSIGSCFGRTNA